MGRAKTRRGLGIEAAGTSFALRENSHFMYAWEAVTPGFFDFCHEGALKVDLDQI